MRLPSTEEVRAVKTASKLRTSFSNGQVPQAIAQVSRASLQTDGKRLGMSDPVAIAEKLALLERAPDAGAANISENDVALVIMLPKVF